MTNVLEESPGCCEDNKVGQEESREASSEATAVVEARDGAGCPGVPGPSLWIEQARAQQRGVPLNSRPGSLLSGAAF